MTRTLQAWCDEARERRALFMAIPPGGSAANLCRLIQDEERAAGEPVSDRETISGALLDALGLPVPAE